MKIIEKISEGVAYTALSVGRWDELGEYVIVMSPEKQLKGKVFVGQALAATGTNVSFQSFPVGGASAFVHTHKTHEEIYIFVKGRGEFQVDGVVFAVGEGSVVRVAPEGKRCVRNVGDEPLVMVCIQHKADSFTAEDARDGNILSEPVVW